MDKIMELLLSQTSYLKQKDLKAHHLLFIYYFNVITLKTSSENKILYVPNIRYIPFLICQRVWWQSMCLVKQILAFSTMPIIFGEGYQILQFCVKHRFWIFLMEGLDHNYVVIQLMLMQVFQDSETRQGTNFVPAV